MQNAFIMPIMNITWSVILGSRYSQKAYPLDKPVPTSLTRLNAFSGPKDVSSSLTYMNKLITPDDHLGTNHRSSPVHAGY